jgi:RNA polymerase sigma-70 factor (ECF subfamily)
MIQPDSESVADLNASGDEELVRLAQQGNLDAFTSLYERYLPMVYNRVRYVVPEQDAEDVTQEIFIGMLKSLKNFKGQSQFSTWLRTLTNRRVADYYRRRSRRGTQIDADVSEVDPQKAPQLQIAASAAAIEDRVMLRQALRAMPKNYQEVLLLRFAEGLQFNEIAQVRGQSLEATKSMFRRAVAALRTHLGEVDG